MTETDNDEFNIFPRPGYNVECFEAQSNHQLPRAIDIVTFETKAEKAKKKAEEKAKKKAEAEAKKQKAGKPTDPQPAGGQTTITPPSVPTTATTGGWTSKAVQKREKERAKAQEQLSSVSKLTPTSTSTSKTKKEEPPLSKGITKTWKKIIPVGRTRGEGASAKEVSEYRTTMQDLLTRRLQTKKGKMSEGSEKLSRTGYLSGKSTATRGFAKLAEVGRKSAEGQAKRVAHGMGKVSKLYPKEAVPEDVKQKIEKHEEEIARTYALNNAWLSMIIENEW